MMYRREIHEAYDTKYEAQDALQKLNRAQSLEEFDRRRTWRSLYDEEREIL